MRIRLGTDLSFKFISTHIFPHLLCLFLREGFITLILELILDGVLPNTEQPHVVLQLVLLLLREQLEVVGAVVFPIPAELLAFEIS